MARWLWGCPFPGVAALFCFFERLAVVVVEETMAKRNGSVSWREKERRHKEVVARKYEKIEMLKALLEMHEKDPKQDHEYLVGLRARLRTAVANLESMTPVKEEEL